MLQRLYQQILNNLSFWENERIRVNAYRVKKKENQSEAKIITQGKKEELRKQKYRFSKSKNEYQKLTTWKQPNYEYCKFMIPQYLGKIISLVC